MFDTVRLPSGSARVAPNARARRAEEMLLVPFRHRHRSQAKLTGTPSSLPAARVLRDVSNFVAAIAGLLLGCFCGVALWKIAVLGCAPMPSFVSFASYSDPQRRDSPSRFNPGECFLERSANGRIIVVSSRVENAPWRAQTVAAERRQEKTLFRHLGTACKAVAVVAGDAQQSWPSLSVTRFILLLEGDGLKCFF